MVDRGRIKRRLVLGRLILTVWLSADPRRYRWGARRAAAGCWDVGFGFGMAAAIWRMRCAVARG